MRRSAVALFLLMVVLLGKAALAAEPLDALAGQWRGPVTQQDPGLGSLSDMAIVVEPSGEKVRLQWTAPGSAALTSTFAPAGPPGVYGAVEGGMFGLFDQHTSRNPLADGSLLWLRVPATGFTLYSLTIADDGGYRLDRVQCTPDGDKLQVRLTRRENGKGELALAATLTRAGG